MPARPLCFTPVQPRETAPRRASGGAPRMCARARMPVAGGCGRRRSHAACRTLHALSTCSTRKRVSLLIPSISLRVSLTIATSCSGLQGTCAQSAAKARAGPTQPRALTNKTLGPLGCRRLRRPAVGAAARAGAGWAGERRASSEVEGFSYLGEGIGERRQVHDVVQNNLAVRPKLRCGHSRRTPAPAGRVGAQWATAARSGDTLRRGNTSL